MRYTLLFPLPDERGSTMLDYIMGQRPSERTYQPVYEGEVDMSRFPSASSEGRAPAVLEFLWQRHNEGDNLDGDRPRATEIRSMCIGDIIRFEGSGRMFVADRVGFRQLHIDETPNVQER